MSTQIQDTIWRKRGATRQSHPHTCLKNSKMKWDSLAVSVLLGICTAAAINLAAPDYTAAILKTVQAKEPSSALEPLYTFLRFVSAFFSDSASGPLVIQRSSTLPSNVAMRDSHVWETCLQRKHALASI